MTSPHDPLPAAFLSARSIAVVGAGDRPSSSGGAVLHNLIKGCYRGRIVPVNPKGGVLFDLPVATSLSAVSPPAELAVIVVRPDLILDVVKEAAASGHRHLLILPGGFAEGAEEGQARDRQLRDLAQTHGIKIGGPNCAGTINLLDTTAPFPVTFFRDLPRGGKVALISQSGAIVEELIGASHRMRLPLGAVVSVGNALHYGLTDYLEALGRDEACEVILLYAESFGDPERFVQVARKVGVNKPIVALVGGRTEAGAAAAFRHTGSRAMRDAEAAAFCASAGTLRVRSLRDLVLAGKAYGSFPRGMGKRVLLLSNSGGPGVLASDRAVSCGLELAPLPAALIKRLSEILPPEATIANPLDLLADAREERFGDTLQAALQMAGDAFDAILMIHVIPFMVNTAAVVQRLAEGAKGAPLPIMHTMMGTLEHKDAWFEQLEAAQVPAFDNVEDMVSAAALLARTDHREMA
ncbi:MAG: hypothetical protein FJY37_03030 [Betaproteobacteria bacterium]|nr:hypothetical protein [Betaproteobacteria bacterium]